MLYLFMLNSKSLRIKKYLGIFIVALLLTQISLGIVSAFNFEDRETISIDESLSEQSQNSYSPSKVVAVAKISAPSGQQYGDAEEWFKGLYYYSITKLGFIDVPFHYIVSWDGNVYEGKGGGKDVQSLCEWKDENESRNPVVIAYFDNGREITNSGRQALADLISGVLSENNLTKSDVIPVDMMIAESEDEIEPASVLIWRTSDELIVNLVEKALESVTVTAVERTYKGSVEEVSYPDSVEAGENFIVTVVLKNEGEYPWYNSGENMAMIGTSEPRGRSSIGFVSDKWSSFSRVVSSNSAWIFPGDTGTFEFEFGTPLIPGTYTEKFELLVLPENWVQGTQFTLDFNVAKGNFDLVEIKDTETGYLNVRDCPGTSCNEIGKVAPGDILIMLAKDGNWYKIKMNNGTEGWVYGKYVKEI